MLYYIEPRDRRYVTDHGFLYFAKNIGRNIGSNYIQKLVDSAKKSATDAIKIISKKAIQKPTETTGYLIDKEISDKITSTSKKSPKEFLSKVLYSKEFPLK